MLPARNILAIGHNLDPVRLRAVSKYLGDDYAPRIELVPATREVRKPLRGRLWHDKQCASESKRKFTASELQFAATIARRIDRPLLANEMFLFDTERMYLDTSIQMEYSMQEAVPAVTEQFADAILATYNTPVDEQFSDDIVLISHNEGGGTWGHYLVQSLPRMLLFLELFPGGKIAIPATYAHGARGFGEALALYDIPPERLAPVQETGVYRLRQAILMDFLFNFDRAAAHPKVLPMLQNLQLLKISRPPRKAAFIKRKTDSCRAIGNAAAVDAVMAHHDIDIYGPETLSLTDQVDLWQSYNLLITTLGSDLTNIVYARPGTRVLVLSPDWFGDVFFFELSVAAGVRWHELRCGEMATRYPGVEHYSDFNVDTELLDEILTGLLAPRRRR